MKTEQQHPYVEQAAEAKAKFEEAKRLLDEAKKRARDFQIPWEENTRRRIQAQQSLIAAKASTPLEQIAQWQTTVEAALFLDAKFRDEYEHLLEAANAAEMSFKNARVAYEGIEQQIAIYLNEQRDKQQARLEAEIEAEVRTTRERLRREARQQAATV